MKCDNCLNARRIISENRLHSVCCLSEKNAMECLMEQKDQRIPTMDRLIEPNTVIATGDGSYYKIKALQEPKAEKVIKMRDATPEERESIAKYIKSISKPTGVDFWNLEQQPCEDAISRQSAIFLANDLKVDLPDDEHIANMVLAHNEGILEYQTKLSLLPLVTPQQKVGHCKDCKYFEYDSVANVDGIPLIVAHEICKRWGDGCKTKEDGYCFLYEPKESEE